MKNYFDGFYELIHKNSVKRRRMFSLLLVLSIFVSSGVLWELRDTVITMVNEPLCGFEEHEHTDECYEKILVCGLEENDEHTHTEECYEKVLKCGHEEHIHIPLCYTDEEKEAEDEAVINEESAFALGNVPEDDIVDDEELVDVELPELTLDNGIEVLADDSSLPATIQTIDNIAEGIKFTLFDYGDKTLEGETNNYNYTDNNDPTKHDNVKYTGINEGRNFNDDIMFFAYGTPPQHGGATGDYLKDGNGNYVLDDNGNKIPMYYPGTHEKNTYTGDYNANSYQTGNRPFQEIVSSELGSDGYPQIRVLDENNNDTKPGNSLAYLFDPSDTYDGEGKRVTYEGVNHLLKKVTSEKGVDHLVYNSNENYAYYNNTTKNFDVYEKTFDIINDNHHKKDDINNIKFDENEQPVKYSEEKDPGFKIGFFPFDQYDETRKDPNYNGNGYNHHFGMTMETKFNNPAPSNISEPVTFKYSGDDDMWVFVDKKLVLDIGGIHEPAGGMIDFTNGLVWVQDNSEGRTLAEIKGNTYTDDEWRKLPKPIGIDTASTSSDAVNKWIVTPISNYIPDWEANKIGKHEIKMFYLERGGCYSNLAMDMNLPTLKPLTVFKNVDYKSHLVKDFDNDEYEFQVWEWDINGNKWIIPQDTNPNAPYYLKDNNFKIKAGERKEFKDLGQDRFFKVVEVGVDPNKFDKVTIETAKGTETKTLNGGGLTDVSLDNCYKLSEANAYTFNNSIREETTKVTVKKKWDPANSKPNDFKMKYKIIRTDLATNEEKQVALLEKDENNNLKKVRTFVLENEEGETKEGLLSRYGDHYYSYRVEELNVPMNFNASYKEIVGQDGTEIEVTNKDDSKVDIYVKKEWENVSDTKPAVQLVLKRESVGYEESKPTDLKITILDEGGNLIKTETISVNDTNKIYAGGSAEISYMLPNGVKLYKGDSNYPQKKIAGEDNPKIISNNNSPNDKLYVKFEEEDNILVVENLAAKEDSGIANEVTFKVTSDTAEDSLLLLHHSFTRGTNGWQTNTTSPTYYDSTEKKVKDKVTPSVNSAYAKGDGLIVQGREKAWNGTKLYLDPALFKANKTYSFSVYIMSPEPDVFKMTFNNGLGENEPLKLLGSNAQSLSVEGNKWTQLTGTIKLTDKIDPYNMYLLIETIPVGDDYTVSQLRGGSFFRMDEFTAIEGTMPVNVSQQQKQGTEITDIGGVVTIGNEIQTVYVDGDYVYNYQNMQDRESKGWNPFGNVNLSDKDAGGGNYAVVVSGRSAEWQGVSKNLNSKLNHNTTYHLFSQVAGNHADNNKTIPHTIIVSLKYNIDGNDAVYKNIASIDTKGNIWGTIDKYFSLDDTEIFDVPVDTSKSMELYYHTNGTESFEVWSSRLSEVTEVISQGVTEQKDGYKIENGKYVSDFSNYVISLDKNSVTNPLYLTGDYVKEDWSKTVTLIGVADEWKYHWSKEDLGEQPETLYRYWVEEVKIGDDDITTVTNLNTRKVTSDNSDYIISYSRDFVPTNTEETPILVKNEYMWYKLPATGGSGTGRIYFLGGIFTAIGIISGSVFYRRKRRRV